MVVENVYDLISAYYIKHPSGHYFYRNTLKFFVECISDMRLIKNIETVTDILGEKHDCYVLSTLQRNNPMGTRRKYTYFNVVTLDNVIL